MSSPLTHWEIKFLSKAPKMAISFGNLTKPFSANAWLLLSMTIAIISVSLFISHRLYSNINLDYVKPEQHWLNFFLFSFCKVTEPEPLPWFVKKGTGGHFLVFNWTILSWVAVMFYLSNLRAHLISVDYEKPIDSLQDVLERSSKIWISETILSSFT